MSCSASYAAANDRPNGGAAVYRNLGLGVTGEVAKASPGRLYGWHVANGGAAKAFVKVYDKATAPTETDTPILTLEIAAGGVVSLAVPPGISFVNGISARGTTGVADNDTGAPGTNDLVVNLLFA